MSNAARLFRPFLFLLMLAAAGCHAQSSSAGGGKLPPELARRVEILIRSKTNLPPNYEMIVGPRARSDVQGFDEITVLFSADGKSSKPMTFLLSTDGKTLAQFNKFDISQDPKTLVSADGRPARGGPANAPVVIVGFDDLECPFCAKMHAQMFPALMQRYKDQVRIVYKDFPLDQHPWAMRAAINVNCLGAQSTDGYWNVVDYIHAHASEMGGAEKTLAKANETLDTITRDEGKKQKVNEATLGACIEKQDETPVRASMKAGSDLGVEATPALFINGERLEGALPIEYVYRMIDNALVAAGQTPPPPVTLPSLSSPPAPTPAPATGQPSGHAPGQ
ncbi:DsbA family protein [Edaphobacter modestus]|uniref:Protein-disulfide isomerase n=1 Tax=Edaphobacter modestus TaxID=388466 RepID=A0A4Q7YYC0_9BACT|nr:DsbA family protein [Edaphobacter modestus]RZU42119.1 protein-disulfide isomerase [Edaphobacter modestus]